MRAKLRLPLLCLLALVATLCRAQNTLNVGAGAPYTTIQSAINAAQAGDTVLVHPGTYYEHIDFLGKALTVTSSAGPATTIIDGSSNGTAVTFKSGETRASILSGFTIQHGGILSYGISSNNNDGGIYLNNSQPTIRNNTLTQDLCWAIFSQASAPLIQSNDIADTNFQGDCNDGEGAAVFIAGNLNYSTITNDGSAAVVMANTIENNTDVNSSFGDNWGTAIHVAQGSPVIMNNVIHNNSDKDGAGGALETVVPTGIAIVQNVIYNNSAACGAGALAVTGYPDKRTGITALIANNTIINNTFKSGAIGSNCTPMAQIWADPEFDGKADPSFLILNNIVAGATTYPATNCDEVGPPSEADQPTFANDILFNSAGPFFGNYCVDVSTKYNNVAADPLLVSPSAANFQLTYASPAIDAGQNDVLALFHTLTGLNLTSDIAGNPRLQAVHGQDCTIDIGAYEYPSPSSALALACGTTETLTSSLNPSSINQSVTLTASLTASTGGTPTGSIQFADGTTTLATVAVSSSGTATYTTSTLAVGTHPITATYQPTGTFSATSATLSQVVNGYPTTTAISCSAQSVLVGNTTPVAITVTSASGTPTGTVTLADNGATLATQTLPSATTTVSYTPTTSGTHTLLVTYNPTGNFAASSATCAETATALPTTALLTATPTASTYGTRTTLTVTVTPSANSSLGTPTGTVTFLNGGATLGTATLTNGTATLALTTLPAGSDALTCTYAGSPVYAASACNTLTTAIAAASTTTTLTASPNPAYLGQTVTLTATLSSSPAATGSILFSDGATTLGTATLTNGTATLPVTTLAAGTHTLTATFAPSTSNFAASTASTTETILPAGFTLTLSPATVTVASGQSVSTTATLGTIGNFTGPLTLSYGTLPPSSTATLLPGTVTLTTNGTASATFTLTTHLLPTSTSFNRTTSTILTALTLLLPFGLRRRRHKAARLLALLLFAGTLTALSGCTTHVISLAHTPPGTYTLPLSATDTSGNTHTANLTVIVTPTP